MKFEIGMRRSVVQSKGGEAARQVMAGGAPFKEKPLRSMSRTIAKRLSEAKVCVCVCVHVHVRVFAHVCACVSVQCVIICVSLSCKVGVCVHVCVCLFASMV